MLQKPENVATSSNLPAHQPQSYDSAGLQQEKQAILQPIRKYVGWKPKFLTSHQHVDRAIALIRQIEDCNDFGKIGILLNDELLTLRIAFKAENHVSSNQEMSSSSSDTLRAKLQTHNALEESGYFKAIKSALQAYLHFQTERSICRYYDNGFTVVTTNKYLNRLQEKINAVLPGHSIDRRTPKFREESIFKLHISLTLDSYFVHSHLIENLLIKYMQQGTIHEFKYIDHQHPVFDPQWPAGPNWLRFRESDQFTIYIPSNYNKDKVVAMCVDIETELNERNDIFPGRIWDVESPVGKYLSFRQEYLQEDFKDGNVSIEQRINVIEPENSSDPRRQAVKNQQEQSELYRAIKARVDAVSRVSTISVKRS